MIAAAKYLLTCAVGSMALIAAISFTGDPVLAQQGAPKIYVNNDLIAEIEAGIFCDVKHVGTNVAPDTDLGHINMMEGPARRVSNSTVVPLVKGLYFGVRSWAVNNQMQTGVTFKTTHPPFLNTGRTSSTHQGGLVAEKPIHQLYAFDFDYEMVAGEWMFEAEYEGAFLYRAHFYLTDPETTGSITPHPCDNVALTS